jgi:perosamine synthetase
MTSTETRIPLSVPVMGGNEALYVNECIDENWVAANGRFTRAFEQAFATRHGVDEAVATSSGTAALHSALVDLGIGPGDEVIVPDLTFIASANPVRYVGATPVLADVHPRSYTLDPACLQEVLSDRTRAVVVVHLYGHPVDMDPVLELAGARGIFVIEDATEALGSTYKGQPCGTLGDIGCFSFNGNKVITTGGGGMLLARDPERLAHMRLLTLQGRVPGSREYVHSEVGFNYVMSNLQAAVGLAQLEQLDKLLAARRAVAERYARSLNRVQGLTYASEETWAHSNFWLGSVLVDPASYGEDRDDLAARLSEASVETRPFFRPLHLQEPYRGCAPAPPSVSVHLHEVGLSVPSSASLEPADQDRVLSVLRRD